MPPGRGAPLTRVKICCIRDEGELDMAVRAGAAAVGLVSAMPSGPGPIADETIARLLRRVPPGVTSFLLTSRTDPAALCGPSWRPTKAYWRNA